MRVNLELEPLKGVFSLPFHYNHHVASLIYRMLALASPSYSRFLHKQGYEGLKLFTFSQLLISSRRTAQGRLEGRGTLSLLISSPITEFMENLVHGFLTQPELLLCDQRFRLQRLEALPRPVLGEEANFTCLSPIVVSRGGEKHAAYLPYDSPQLSQAVRQNLQRKLRLILSLIHI